ncbi:tRNA1(Val) (adenine(37)-N6)-methyltransferase [Hymenobacter sp. AT01-02]|uniref:tRNA1(Val) (adenine(37)-N6)-methyltransferase n=1 Tax=Hymenobacter sp. AT01-02 TaxID=1571877 RepID=UPI0005F14666|nr:methyltransferase [Hymenobacter sp. AT01-02]
MSNSYFQFKQFRIEQSNCAMKVCTDACVLGAVAGLEGASRILDIGTGTGLLALMAAQRAPGACIEAVELDPAAAIQAAANFKASPWTNRLQLHPQPLAQFAASQPYPFDYIICNPPFFRDSLRSPSAQRTTARHTAEDTLTFTELAAFATKFLTPEGQLTVLLPPPEMEHFVHAATVCGLWPRNRIVLVHRRGSKPQRHILTFTRRPSEVAERVLPIKAADSDTYSEEFQTLLTPFYLHL